METPKMEVPSTEPETTSNQESLETAESQESVRERINTLKAIVEQFDSNVAPALKAYESVYFKESVTNEIAAAKRKSLAAVTSALAVYENSVMDMLESFEKAGGASGLNDIMWAAKTVQERLIEAPDAEHSRAAQIEDFGAENIPAGTFAFEHTKESILALKAQIAGVKSALIFLNPTKIRQ